MKIFTEGQLVEKLTLHKVTPIVGSGCWVLLPNMEKPWRSGSQSGAVALNV